MVGMKNRFIFALLWVFVAFVSRAEERLWVDATINGQQAHLIFDTGADRLILFRKGAERLGLQITEPQPDLAPPPGAVTLAATELCEVTFLDNSIITSLGVLEMPSYLDMQADGVLGWGMFSKSVVRIDSISSKVELLEDAPEQLDNWTKLKLRTNSGYLSFEVPHANARPGLVLVDTGFAGGVAVPPATWQAWNTIHPEAPTTLDSYFMPGAGLVVKEETWAGAIGFGPLLLTEVPMMEANQAQLALGSVGYEASLGLAALRRLELIIDGTRDVAYVRLKSTPPPPYQHNRLGAVFVPANPHNDDLVARVAKRSPAHDAGICNGDVLVKIGKLDATKWRSDPAIMPLSQFWTQPPETKLALTLKRDSQTYTTIVMLRQILAPGLSSSLNPDRRS
jgi:hypothetical protein